MIVECIEGRRFVFVVDDAAHTREASNRSFELRLCSRPALDAHVESIDTTTIEGL